MVLQLLGSHRQIVIILVLMTMHYLIDMDCLLLKMVRLD